jgi:hypothetical protein
LLLVIDVPLDHVEISLHDPFLKLGPVAVGEVLNTIEELLLEEHLLLSFELHDALLLLAGPHVACAVGIDEVVDIGDGIRDLIIRTEEAHQLKILQIASEYSNFIQGITILAGVYEIKDNVLDIGLFYVSNSALITMCLH